MNPAILATADNDAIKRQDLPQPRTLPGGRAPDLFDTLPTWLNTPTLAYSSWIGRQALKESTKTVYIAMFGRFCQWLEEQGRTLDQLEAADIGRFLESANPNLPESRRRAQTGRQRQQYVRQLEKVFAHLGALGRAGPNPGRVAGYERVGAGSDKPTRFLTREESQAVISLVQTRLEELKRDERDTEEWMEYRDLALVSVLVGAGLKVGHVERLTLNCIDFGEGRIDLSLTRHAHRARILDFALGPLQAWLAVQARLHGGRLEPVQKVFEADRSSGKSRLCKAVALSSSSIHRRTQRLLSLAGITGERASAQTLRNTYAGLLIEDGASDEHLVDCLGLKAVITAQRMRAAYALRSAAAKPASSNPSSPDQPHGANPQPQSEQLRDLPSQT